MKNPKLEKLMQEYIDKHFCAKNQVAEAFKDIDGEADLTFGTTDKKVKFNEAVENSETVEALYEALVSDKLTLETTDTAAFARAIGKTNNYLHRLYGDIEWNQTWSEAGSLKIGKEDFAVLIPNSNGDGHTFYCVIDEDKAGILILMKLMNYVTHVYGSFDVYAEDTNDNYGLIVKETIGEEGDSYSVYSFSDYDDECGNVVFAKN